MKQCTKCKKLKSKSEFSKDSSRKDRLTLWCKDCLRVNARKRYEKKRGTVKKYNSYKDLHRVAGGIKQKRCGRCKKWKAESQYYKHSRFKDGLAVWCKECADKATNKAHKERLAIRN